MVADRAEPELDPGLAVRLAERVRPGRLAEPHGTLSAVAVFGREGRCFRTNEIGSQCGPVPPGSTGLGPAVEVFRMAADMTHRIHRTGPAHRAPPRPRMCASCHGALRHGCELPIDLGALQKRPGGRIGDVGVLGFFARFQQEDAEAWPFSQPRGKHAARRPGSDDDDVRLGHDCAEAFKPVISWLAISRVVEHVGLTAKNGKRANAWIADRTTGRWRTVAGRLHHPCRGLTGFPQRLTEMRPRLRRGAT